MAPLLSLLNRLLPFATPGTPLVQDLLHLAAICLLLYVAPQVHERLQASRHVEGSGPEVFGLDLDENARDDHAQNDNVELDHGVNGDRLNEEHVDEQRDDNLNNENVPPGNLQPDVGFGEGEAGPAHAPNIPPQRNVGAKKAKALARRDQRRAYNEFMRSQGDAQRARDAEGAAERETALAAEKERRKATTAALEAKKAKEREQRRQREEAERHEEIRRRELAVGIITEELTARMVCDLFQVARQVGGDVDEDWVEKIVMAAGLVGKKDDSLTIVTGMGWLVRVTSEDMATLYRTAVVKRLGDDHGHITPEAISSLLESTLKAQPPAK